MKDSWKEIITKIVNELNDLSTLDLNKKYKSKFFKEEIKTRGIKTAAVKKISAEYFRQIKNLDKKQIFSLCEKLLKNGYNSEATIAFDWLFKVRKKLQKEDFKIFKEFIEKYIDNWAKCDICCTRALGYLIYEFPELIKDVKELALSENRWVRRASAVSLIYTIKRRNELNSIFKIADILLEDKDDMVQKGYGWMLKEASNIYQKDVFDYILKKKEKMPRTALRYAIENIPDELRKEAMKKD